MVNDDVNDIDDNSNIGRGNDDDYDDDDHDEDHRDVRMNVCILN